MKIHYIVILIVSVTVIYRVMVGISHKNSDSIIVINKNKSQKIIAEHSYIEENNINNEKNSSKNTESYSNNVEINTVKNNSYTMQYSNQEYASRDELYESKNKLLTHNNFKTSNGNISIEKTQKNIDPSAINNIDNLYSDSSLNSDYSQEVIEKNPQSQCPKSLYLGGTSYGVLMLKMAGCPKPDNYNGDW